MKRMMSILLISLFAALPLFAGISANEMSRIEMAKKALMIALKSENDGVRSGAIHVIAKIKGEYPATDLTLFNKTLTDLAEKDVSSYIRANANLAYIYINSSELPQKVNVFDDENPGVFFNALYTELNQDFFALNK